MTRFLFRTVLGPSMRIIERYHFEICAVCLDETLRSSRVGGRMQYARTSCCLHVKRRYIMQLYVYSSCHIAACREYQDPEKASIDILA